MLPTCTENRGAHMKKIVISLLLLTLSFRLSAQIDYLEPVKPFTTYTRGLGDVYKRQLPILVSWVSIIGMYFLCLIQVFNSLLMRVTWQFLLFRRSMQCR